MASKSPAISLNGVTKRFGEVTAVDALNLDIQQGEFFSMLGPSGSGKTTVLRMIAGFDLPTSGKVFLQGKDVTELAPFDRDVNTVFQDYALFNHMTVYENVEYGLKVRKVSKEDRKRRVKEALETVRLADFGSRKPSQLSGGQRQRIGIARALYTQPELLILDEATSALDGNTESEISKTIHSLKGKKTVIVIAHRLSTIREADKIVYMSGGEIISTGSLKEVRTRVPEFENQARLMGL